MLVALIDSGRGLLPTAALLRRSRPDLDLLLATDPDGVPWGPKPASWVIDRVLVTVQECRRRGAAAIVLPCNTASVAALDAVRQAVPATLPVIGTVPAIKPAAGACRTFAVWATAATTASDYQADLIAEFASERTVFPVACHGLAEAIEDGDPGPIAAAIAAAAAATPAECEGVVLGCTHYPLVAEEIAAALPSGMRLFDSSAAVAAQVVRRIPALRPGVGTDTDSDTGTVTVMLSGRPAGNDVERRFSRRLAELAFASHRSPSLINMGRDQHRVDQHRA